MKTFTIKFQSANQIDEGDIINDFDINDLGIDYNPYPISKKLELKLIKMSKIVPFTVGSYIALGKHDVKIDEIVYKDTIELHVSEIIGL